MVPGLQTQEGATPVESEGHGAVDADPTQANVENEVRCATQPGLLQRHCSPSITPSLQLMRVQTPSIGRKPEMHLQVPEPGSTVPPEHGMTLSTHLPGVPVWVRGSQGASGAQFGPEVPAGHTFGPVPATHWKVRPLPVNVVPAGQPQTPWAMVPPVQVMAALRFVQTPFTSVCPRLQTGGVGVTAVQFGGVPV